MNQYPNYPQQNNQPPEGGTVPPQSPYGQPLAYGQQPVYVQQQPVYYMPPQPVYYQPQPMYAPQSAFNTAEWQKTMYYKGLRKKERNEIIAKGFALGGAIIAMLIIETIIVLALNAAGKYSLMETNATFANCFNIFAAHICGMAIPFTLMWLIMKKKATKPLIPAAKLGFKKTFLWVGIGMLGCLAANYVTEFVIWVYDLFGYELTQPEFPQADSIIACIAVFFSTAIAPGLFEEYAFRCCSLSLLKKHGKAFSVVAVSIVFGLMHGNMIQFVFAFIVGLVLGYITLRTNSVLPAMVIHACNNGISVVQEIVTYAAGEDASNYAGYGLILAWLIAGVVALVYMLVKNKQELLPAKEPKAEKMPYSLNLAERLLCLLPGLFVPIIILIVETSQYVTKV